eukprot:7389250-Prymnesium_polylepis.1
MACRVTRNRPPVKTTSLGSRSTAGTTSTYPLDFAAANAVSVEALRRAQVSTASDEVDDPTPPPPQDAKQ